MNTIWSDESWNDYVYWQGQDKKTLRKINDFIKDIKRNKYECKGKPEQLKGDLSGFWSVRIDEKNRLVFKITDAGLEIAQCKTHYQDK